MHRQRYYCHFDTLLHSPSQEMVRRGSCLALCCCVASSCERIVDSYSISQSKQQRITSTNNKNIGCLLCTSDFFCLLGCNYNSKRGFLPFPIFANIFSVKSLEIKPLILLDNIARMKTNYRMFCGESRPDILYAMIARPICTISLLIADHFIN
jgi:hypothetical protein